MSKNTEFSPRFADMLQSLTIEQAMQWHECVEKFTFVVDNVLVDNNFRSLDRLVNAVEDRFEYLIAN